MGRRTGGTGSISTILGLLFGAFNTQLLELADGTLQILDSFGSNGVANSVGLLFGTNDANGVRIVRNAAGSLLVRAGDNSAVAIFGASQFRAFGAPSNGGSGVSYGGTTSTTIGAAGAAAALPAQPLGYININIGATTAKIPYYNS